MPRYSAKIRMSGGNLVPVVIETDSRWNAEELLKAQYPGHDISFLEEIAPDSNGAETGSATRQQDIASRGAESRSGCLGIALGIVCIAAYLAYRAMFPGDAQTGITAPVGQAESIAPRAPEAPEASLARPGESDADATATVSGDEVPAESTAVSLSASPAVDTTGEEFPFAARLVDRRSKVVLQSGPGITSRNVAKLETGATVYASATDGKWIRVRTRDGLVGFVRRKQLDFTSMR